MINSKSWSQLVQLFLSLSGSCSEMNKQRGKICVQKLLQKCWLNITCLQTQPLQHFLQEIHRMNIWRLLLSIFLLWEGKLFLGGTKMSEKELKKEKGGRELSGSQAQAEQSWCQLPTCANPGGEQGPAAAGLSFCSSFGTKLIILNYIQNRDSTDGDVTFSNATHQTYCFLTQKMFLISPETLWAVCAGDREVENSGWTFLVLRSSIKLLFPQSPSPTGVCEFSSS